MPSPADVLPELDDRQLDLLRRVGQEWTGAPHDSAGGGPSLPVDPRLGVLPTADLVTPEGFGRLVTIGESSGGPRSAAEGSEVPRGPGPTGRARRALLGPPLKSTALARESMRKLVALPVLSADALSSVAYGPEAMLAVLVLAGAAGLALSLPIAGAIAFLMLAVSLSYRQTVRAYPRGGGSYIVASDNLGRLSGLAAAAGLMTDYVLTVAVSIASGVAAITSALPGLGGATVPIGVGVIAVLLAGNMRGIRQAGALFAAPTYAFLLAMFALLAAGAADAYQRGFQSISAPATAHAAEGLGLLLVMRAFASGATAMTGIEAISNAVPAFKPVRWRNARVTLTVMATLLITLFAGVMFLTHMTGVVPNGRETVLSQLAHLTFGSGPAYLAVQAATAAVLLLAANTAYNDFPRVLYLLARDHYAPRLFLRLGDRLAFSNGIALLSVAAGLVFVAFSGSTAALIPLYAVGVFLAFTLSQAGMVVHWWRLRDTHWHKSLVFNAIGCLLCALVLVTAAITKFAAGAWVALVIIALFLFVTTRIRRHYDEVARALRLHPDSAERPGHTLVTSHRAGSGALTAPSRGEQEETPAAIHHLAVVAIASLDLAGLRALAYAAALQQPMLALHISPSDEEAERFRRYWEVWGDHLPLRTLVSPYRVIAGPLVHYVEAIHREHPDLTVTVILPEIVTRRLRHRPLHSGIAGRLRRALRPLPKVVVTTVPFHID
ncbi:APC family permease [Streptomyces sp. SJ1-7]|nr:APC family permease [Streptomyces sp. SJ1-7]